MYDEWARLASLPGAPTVYTDYVLMPDNPLTWLCAPHGLHHNLTAHRTRAFFTMVRSWTV